LLDEFDVALDWNGYELHPDTPTDGLPLERFLPDAEAMIGYVAGFAARFGIRDLRRPMRLANTRRALAVAERARDLGRLDAFRAAAFDGYWRRGRDLGAPADLAAIAAQAGWSERAVTRMVATYAHAVDERRLDEIDRAFERDADRDASAA